MSKEIKKTSSQVDLSLVARMEDAVLAAAAYMLSQVENPGAIKSWQKDDKTLVMTLDIECQRIVSEKLGKDLPIVGEEDIESHKFISSADSYFLIDPVDGTTSCKRFLNERGGQIGFGTLVGLVQGGKIVASVFYHVPHRKLFTAVRGSGAWTAEWEPGKNLPDLYRRERLKIAGGHKLNECGVLFFPGLGGELRLLERLKGSRLVENAYRFGGFANDCVRLAQGFEQVQVQFSVKSWDFSASLIAAEAGLKVVVDPRGEKVDLYDWTVKSENPVISAEPQLMPELQKIMDEVYRGL